MEVIDFKKLLREERKRAKQKKKERESQKAVKVPSEDEKKEREDDSVVRGSNGGKRAPARYNWEYSDGFLGFRALSLRTLCDDPRSISYSPKALEDQTPELLKTNEDESAINGSNVLAPDFATRTTNTVAPMSPEIALINWLRDLPSGDSGLGEWKVMSYGKRRVCMFGEETDAPLPPPLMEIANELVKQNVFPPSSCPPPNHVLLNEYQPGQGIFPHTDGPRYEHRTATLSLGSDVLIEFTKRFTSSEIGSAQQKTIANSAGGDDHGEKGENGNSAPLSDAGDQSSSAFPIQVLLESGSILVFQGDAYLNYCHGIRMDVLRDTTTDHCLNAPSGKIIPRGLRYSLTFRHKKTETKPNTRENS